MANDILTKETAAQFVRDEFRNGSVQIFNFHFDEPDMIQVEFSAKVPCDETGKIFDCEGFYAVWLEPTCNGELRLYGEW